MTSKTLAVKNLVKPEGKMTYKAKFEIHYIEGNSLPHFSVTGEIRENGRIDSCGCLHDMIAEQFPEFAKFIPYHLCDIDGNPMYYYENSLYHLKTGNIDGFKSCSLFGILDGDNNWNPENVEYIYNRGFLENRLPDVKKSFNISMAELFGGDFVTAIDWTIKTLKKQLS